MAEIGKDEGTETGGRRGGRGRGWGRGREGGREGKGKARVGKRKGEGKVTGSTLAPRERVPLWPAAAAGLPHLSSRSRKWPADSSLRNHSYDSALSLFLAHREALRTFSSLSVCNIDATFSRLP